MVMPAGGGSSLGTAQGRISIDVSNVQQAATVVKQAASEMTAAFNAMNQAARQASVGVSQIATASRRINQNTKSAAAGFNQLGTAVTNASRKIETAGSTGQRATSQIAEGTKRAAAQTESLGKQLTTVAGNLFVFSAAATVLTVTGVQAASTMEILEIRFKAMAGSADAASQQISELTTEAARYNLPLLETLTAIARLQPILRATGNETNRFVGLVARLASINPLQGFEGAAISIGEALSGTGNDFRSLQERFNIPRTLLRQSIAETGNFADALDDVLSKLGVTDDVAVEIGQTFAGSLRRATDEAKRLLGEGFRPLLDNVITPLLQKFAEMVKTLNDMNSPVTTVVAGVLAMTAAASPLLYAVGKISTLWETVGKNIGLAARSQQLLRVGATALAVAGGYQAGLLVNRVAGGETQESAQSRIDEFFTQSLALIISALEAAASALGTTLIYAGEQIGLVLEAFASIIREGGALITQAFGAVVEGIGSLLNNQSLVAVGQTFQSLGEYNAQKEQAARNGIVSQSDNSTRERQLVLQANGGITFDFAARVLEIYNRIAGRTPAAETSASTTGSDVSGTGFNKEQIDAYRQFREQMQELEASYNENVLRETQQFNQRRNDIILDYNEKVVEALEDEFRRRTEAEEDLAREIADVQEDSAKAQAKAQRDLQDEIAKIIRESRIRVLEAASQLDARAVFEEQRRTRARIAELKDDSDKQAEERRKETEDKIAQLQDDFKREEAKRAEAFQRKLAELDKQKNRELQQLQQQHNARLYELQNQYNRERQQMNNKFAQELNDLAGQNGRMLNLHRAGQAQIEYELLAWYSRMQAQFRVGSTPIMPVPQPAPYPGRPAPTPYQTGTSYVPATSIYKLHAGEGVMTPEVNSIARSMLGGNYTQQQLAGLFTNNTQTSAGSSFDFSGMQVVLGDVGNRSNADISSMIEDGLYQFFMRASAQSRAMVG